MIAPNIALTTASTTLFTLLASTRALVLTNSVDSAGDATFTVRGDQTNGFADQTLSPGASTTLSVQPGLTSTELGDLCASAASTASKSNIAPPLALVLMPTASPRPCMRHPPCGK